VEKYMSTWDDSTLLTNRFTELLSKEPILCDFSEEFRFVRFPLEAQDMILAKYIINGESSSFEDRNNEYCFEGFLKAQKLESKIEEIVRAYLEKCMRNFYTDNSNKLESVDGWIYFTPDGEREGEYMEKFVSETELLFTSLSPAAQKKAVESDPYEPIDLDFCGVDMDFYYSALDEIGELENYKEYAREQYRDELLQESHDGFRTSVDSEMIAKLLDLYR